MDDAPPLEALPGYAHLGLEVQALLQRAQAGENGVRAQLLERVAEILTVFVGLDVLQFVFMPSPQDDGAEPVTVDLVAPEDDSAAIAWFSVDEAGYDEFRDAVTLFGDVVDVLNPPIVLDVDDDEEETLRPED